MFYLIFIKVTCDVPTVPLPTMVYVYTAEHISVGI